MKKIIALMLAPIMIVSAVALTACGDEMTDAEAPTEPPTETPTETPTEPEPEIIPETPYALDCFRINGSDIREYAIVSDTTLGGVMMTAATELQKYIELTCGVNLKIVEGSVPVGTKRILIDADSSITDDSTWRVYTDEDGLVLAGTAKRGTLHAVYYFLEKHLDWRFFTSDCETVYEHSLIDLKNIDDSFTHIYKVRGLYGYDYKNNPSIYVKRYFNESSACYLPPELGGNETFTNIGNGIHTFWIINGDPEEINQPCLNDPVTRERMRDFIRNWLDEHPDATAIHVSQNDNERYCQCEECLKDIEYYGAPSGSIIEFLNYICEDLETYNGGAYKDVLVVTFAYRYSFTAPQNIICHDNVVIEYTLIDLCHQHPITHPNCDTPNPYLIRNNQDIVVQLENWAKISKRCIIYDYGLNCRYYYAPFPDFDILRENYRFFAGIGAWGYWNLCNPHQNGCDFSELRFYLYAKLIEDPYMSEEQFNTHISEFLEAYYGPAAPYMKEYFDWTMNLANERDNCFNGYDSPETVLGTKVFGENSDYLVDLFNKALASVENDEERLTRVRRIRVGMEYIRIGDLYGKEMNSRDDERKNAMIALIENFWTEVRDLGLVWVYESGTIPEAINYRQNPRRLFQWLHQFNG